MNGASDTTTWLGWLAAGLVAVGLAVLITGQSTSKGALLRMRWEKYVAELDHHASFLWLSFGGARIASLQLAAGVLLVVWSVVGASIAPLFFAPFVAVAPMILLRRARERRVLALQDQLDGWLMVLANSLRATPAIGQALESTARLVSTPLSQELDLIIKEVQLGTPLDQALANASERIGSRSVSSALSVLVIARRTGGDLPAILERSAEQLREMARLEGVVRTKTAEARMQGWVLAVMPFVMVGALHLMDPTWFVPLTSTFAGAIVISLSTAIWLAAIFAARKILAVDI